MSDDLQARVATAREMCGCVNCHPRPYEPAPTQPLPTSCLAEEILNQLGALAQAEAIRKDLETELGRPVPFIGDGKPQ